jgi:hypothetical protein
MKALSAATGATSNGLLDGQYIQYQTDSNGESKTHADKVDNEWPTAGLGRVQPAAGFR